jgi:pimeloyl-ACP methyl ester carboxylesterase
MRRATGFINNRIKAASGNPSRWEGGVIETFTDQMREPERAKAISKLYRWAVAGGIARIGFGRYRNQRLSTPTLLLFGADDFAIPPEALEGYQEHADDMRLEVVPDCGHFIVDERPELVLERAQSFFA